MVLVACGISLERRPYRAGWRGFRLVPSRLSVFARWLMRRICHVSSQPIKGRKEEKHDLFHLFPLLSKRLCVRQFFFPYSFERRTVGIDWLRIWLGGSTRCSGPIQVLKEITISRLVHAWPTNHSIFKQRTFSWVFNSFMARILFICI